MKRTKHVTLKVLPGEPLDGSGRVCVHLFVRDPRGYMVEPHVLHPVAGGKFEARPTRGKLACGVRLKRGEVTLRSDDVRAVTCPKCLEQVPAEG